MPLPDKFNSTMLATSIILGLFIPIAIVETAVNGLHQMGTFLWWSAVAIVATTWGITLYRITTGKDAPDEEQQ